MNTLAKYHLKENPFDIFSHEHKMADRKEAWETITKSLEAAFSGKGPRYFVILGDYGVGKSYILERIFKWVSQEKALADVFVAYSGQDVLYERRLALQESEPRWSKFGLDLIMRIFDNMDPTRLVTVMRKAKLDKINSRFKPLFMAISDNNEYALRYLRGDKIPTKELASIGGLAPITDSPTSLALFFDFLLVIHSAGYSSFLLLVDEFEKISEQGERRISQILNTFRTVFDTFGDYVTRCKGQIAKPIFTFATSPGGWERLKDLEAAAIKKTGGAGIAPFMERVSPRDIIRLQPFSLENTVELVTTRLAEARISTKEAIEPLFPFTERTVIYVHEVSFNKPRNVLQYCGILLEDALQQNLDTIDINDASKILQKYGINLVKPDNSKESSQDKQGHLLQ